MCVSPLDRWECIQHRSGMLLVSGKLGYRWDFKTCSVATICAGSGKLSTKLIQSDRPGSPGTRTLSANSPFSDRRDLRKVENFFKFGGALSSSFTLTPLPARLWSLFDKECRKAGLKAKMGFPIGCWDVKEDGQNLMISDFRYFPPDVDGSVFTFGIGNLN